MFLEDFKDSVAYFQENTSHSILTSGLILQNAPLLQMVPENDGRGQVDVEKGKNEMIPKTTTQVHAQLETAGCRLHTTARRLPLGVPSEWFDDSSTTQREEDGVQGEVGAGVELYREGDMSGWPGESESKMSAGRPQARMERKWNLPYNKGQY